MNARAAMGTRIVSLALAALAASCGNDSTSSASPADAAPSVEAAIPTVVQRGRVVDFTSKKAVAGASIVAGGQTVQSGADGTYALSVDQRAEFSMNVTAPSYVKLIEQTTLLEGDRDRGDTLLVAKTDSDLLKLALDEYDASRGVLSIQILPVGSCAHVAGAKVHVDIDGAKIAYFNRRFPTPGLEEAKDDELPTAVIYNLPTGRDIQVEIEHSSCKVVPFPYVYTGITYLAQVKTEAGDVTSFARFFLE